MGIILLTGAYAALQSAAAGLTTALAGSTIGAGAGMYAGLQSLAAAACGPVGLAVGGVVLAGAALIPFV